MNEFLRRVLKVAESRQSAGPTREVSRYGGHEQHRDARPGRYAVTGPFVRLPESQATTRPSGDA